MNQAAWVLYQGRFKEFSYNSFYISAEEFYKCFLLLPHLETKKVGEEIAENDINELAHLFAHHIFKIRGSQIETLKSIRKKRFVVIRQNRPDLNSAEEGRKLKSGKIKQIEKYSPEELFVKKNESLYVGYKESQTKLSNPVMSFQFDQPNIMMAFISELKSNCEQKVYDLFGREKIEEAINYMPGLNSVHTGK